MSAPIPGYWMAETTGQLRPAVMAYLANEPMDDRKIAAMRAYLRQWMACDWKGPMIDVLRTQVEDLTTKEDITRWLDRAQTVNIDPL
jgi:hypothetical protein